MAIVRSLLLEDHSQSIRRASLPAVPLTSTSDFHRLLHPSAVPAINFRRPSSIISLALPSANLRLASAAVLQLPQRSTSVVRRPSSSGSAVVLNLRLASAVASFGGASDPLSEPHRSSSSGGAVRTNHRLASAIASFSGASDPRRISSPIVLRRYRQTQLPTCVGLCILRRCQ